MGVMVPVGSGDFVIVGDSHPAGRKVAVLVIVGVWELVGVKVIDGVFEGVGVGLDVGMGVGEMTTSLG